jgi:regulator of sigma E protease
MMILYAAALLGILIFVHELGHFIFAKTLGVKVLKFSLGFGPKIIGKTYGETEYRISALPLGGYVKMLGEEPGEELQESEKHRAYNNQPVWKRFSIVFFGPLFNISFAAIVFFFIFLNGVPVSYPDVGKIMEGSPAAITGLKTGDRVLGINGNAVHSWLEIDTFLIENPGKTLLFKLKRGEDIVELSVKPEKKAGKNLFGEDKEVWDIGILPLLYPVIGEVMKGTPAESAGLNKGDKIVEIEGTPLELWQDMTEIIHKSPEIPLRFVIERDKRLMELTITPESKTMGYPGAEDKEIGIIGIKPKGNDFIKKFGFIEAFPLAIERTVDISALTLVAIVKLIQRVIPAETMGGPILIFQMAGQRASQGALDFFMFMAVISINLGILNLLPIPILDGGHLVFLGLEAIRRKPLTEKFIINAQKIGLLLLLTLIAFVTYNDILRLITGKMFP